MRRGSYKKLILFLVAFSMTVFLCACDSSEAETAAQEQEEIVQQSQEDSEEATESGSVEEEEKQEEQEEQEEISDTEENRMENLVVSLDDLADMLENALQENVPSVTFRVVAGEDDLSVMFCWNEIGFEAVTMALTYEDDPDGWAECIEVAEWVYEEACAYCEGAGMPDVPINVVWVSEDDINEVYYAIFDEEVVFDCVEALHAARDGYITKAKYDEIVEGMNYSEIVAIIGSDGELSAESSVSGNTVEIYTWTAEDGIGTMSITFQNGIAIAKAQAGLK